MIFFYFGQFSCHGNYSFLSSIGDNSQPTTRCTFVLLLLGPPWSTWTSLVLLGPPGPWSTCSSLVHVDLLGPPCSSLVHVDQGFLITCGREGGAKLQFMVFQLLIYHTWYKRDFRKNTEISAMRSIPKPYQPPHSLYFGILMFLYQKENKNWGSALWY